ncbi:hypothetical protein [Kineococcus sp. SYSU DK006]|uniref:hypothetical protein n=1 Tax=Kineococcus sp. SYSU DK006 TaxID=3383127 RepID=UPI003D7E4613
MTVATASFATLTLLPWVVEAGRTPRAGLVAGAVPLALLFGALAGYAASPAVPTLVVVPDHDCEGPRARQGVAAARPAGGSAPPVALPAPQHPPGAARSSGGGRLPDGPGRATHLHLVPASPAADPGTGAADGSSTAG